MQNVPNYLAWKMETHLFNGYSVDMNSLNRYASYDYLLFFAHLMYT